MPISSASTVAISAIIATSGVIDGPEYRVLEGGERALQMTQLCIEDGRDIEKSFILQKQFGYSGHAVVNCQYLETTSGLYVAAKGYYQPTPMLKDLAELFEDKGYKVQTKH
ncbi:hypothetical protein [Thiomicrospira pelophila]|uniref:hypothetical protein n=1 Tax=Thiomicrospira pelophila TaxID=934 RepID=UPI0004A75FCE|nr:hypothetical protein [Thiomicrospira pelophila]